MRVGGQRHAPAALIPGKDPVPILQEAGWAPGPVWIGVENLAPIGIGFPDLPIHSESLHWLRYPGPPTNRCTVPLFHDDVSLLLLNKGVNHLHFWELYCLACIVYVYLLYFMCIVLGVFVVLLCVFVVSYVYLFYFFCVFVVPYVYLLYLMCICCTSSVYLLYLMCICCTMCVLLFLL
jgi:hypothetical protein